MGLLDSIWQKSVVYSNQSFDFLKKCVGSRIFLILSFVWFLFQTIYMAVSTKFGIGPDEISHYGFIKLYAHSGWLPFLHSQAGYYYLGEVRYTPFFLYHYLLSLPFHFFSGSSHSVFILRLINIGLAVCSLLIINRIAKQLKLSPVVKNLSLFMLINTLMFVFISASISYDNLVILLSMACFSLMLDLIKKFKTTKFLLLVAALLAGTMVVINFLPIGVGVVAVLIYKYFHKIKATAREFKSDFPRKKYINIALVLLIVILAGLFSQRYVYNEIRFHHYQPDCSLVNSLPNCEKSGLYVESQIFSKETTRYSISKYSYVSRWVSMMRDWIFGILGQRHVLPTGLIRRWSEILLIFGTLVIVRFYKFRDNRFNPLIAIGIFYTLILIYTNYNGYHDTGLIQLAVQGRYWFLILPIAYLLVNFYIFKIKKAIVPAIYILITFFVFMSAGLPSYIKTTDPSWHTSSTVQVNQSLKNAMENL